MYVYTNTHPHTHVCIYICICVCVYLFITHFHSLPVLPVQAAMLRSEGLLKELRVHFIVHALVRVHLPKQGTLHHLRRLARLAIQVEPR